MYSAFLPGIPLAVLIITIDIGYWQVGNVWSAMAIQDELTTTQTNKAAVVQNLNLVFGLFSNYDQFG